MRKRITFTEIAANGIAADETTKNADAMNMAVTDTEMAAKNVFKGSKNEPTGIMPFKKKTKRIS